MALFTKTISAGINLFGAAPSTKWGQAVTPYTMTWGVTSWGEGSSKVPFIFVKLIASNSITLDSSIVTIQNRVKSITNTLAMTGEPSYESIRSGIWDLVFVPNTVNAKERVFTDWDSPAGSTTSYSCGSAGSTTWT